MRSTPLKTSLRVDVIGDVCTHATRNRFRGVLGVCVNPDGQGVQIPAACILPASIPPGFPAPYPIPSLPLNRL